MNKILVLDNYDSFTFNLVHIIRALGYSDQLTVSRNDKISLSEVAAFDKIMLSPGPGLPKDAGIMPALIREYAPSKSIFGVCLGLQAMAEAFGGELYNLKEVLHGVAKKCKPTMEDVLFQGLPETFQVCRYHSWAVKEENLPTCLLITSKDEDGVIMSLRHKEFNVSGVQFHPESIITEYGVEMVRNWLEEGNRL